MGAKLGVDVGVVVGTFVGNPVVGSNDGEDVVTKTVGEEDGACDGYSVRHIPSKQIPLQHLPYDSMKDRDTSHTLSSIRQKVASRLTSGND